MPDPAASPAAEYLIISGSLHSQSYSRAMAEALRADYAARNATAQLVDLREYVLPLCDGEKAYGHSHVAALAAAAKAARVIVVATPIYNYDVNAAVKNLVELTGRSWEDKTVGFLCAAGGAGSYMSVMALANSLMLDFRCLIIPRFVYAREEDFTEEAKPKPALLERIVQLADASIKIRNAA